MTLKKTKFIAESDAKLMIWAVDDDDDRQMSSFFFPSVSLFLFCFLHVFTNYSNWVDVADSHRQPGRQSVSQSASAGHLAEYLFNRQQPFPLSLCWLADRQAGTLISSQFQSQRVCYILLYSSGKWWVQSIVQCKMCICVCVCVNDDL